MRDGGKTVFEDAGVMPNPTLEKLYEGCRIAKENKVDLILAVGGGSVVIMPRLFQFPLTAKLIHGKNIICGWKRWIIRLSRLAVF